MSQSTIPTLADSEVRAFADQLYKLWRKIPVAVRLASRKYYYLRLKLLEVNLPAGASGVEARNRRSEDLCGQRAVLQFLYGMRFEDTPPVTVNTAPFETRLQSVGRESAWYAAWNATVVWWAQPSVAIDSLGRYLEQAVRLHTINDHEMDLKILSRLHETFPKLEELAAGLRILEATAAKFK